jgi:hypothetical protein
MSLCKVAIPWHDMRHGPTLRRKRRGLRLQRPVGGRLLAVGHIVDNLFLLAVAAFGLGLSLTSYRVFARHYRWPMGLLQAEVPAIPVLIGLVSLLAGAAFAVARGPETGGWIIVVGGVLLAALWIGLLRVASQIALLLAPAAAFLLLLGWFAEPLGLHARPWATETLSETLARKTGEIESSLRTRLLECEQRAEPSRR